MTSWWKMHGYALYIWPAYGLVVMVLLGNVWRARWRSHHVRRQLKQWMNS